MQRLFVRVCLSLVIAVCAVHHCQLEANSGRQPASEVDYYADDPRLIEYIEASLLNNPALQESLARYRAALQRTSQVSALPDPMLSYSELLRGMENRMVSVSQTFPWFGKLDLEGRAAVKEALVQYREHQLLQRELIAQVKEAYYELLYVERALKILQEEELLLDHYERLAQSLYATGEGLQQGVIKIQSELTQLIDRRTVLQQQRQLAAARLNTLVNRSSESEVSVTPAVTIPEVKPDLEELYELGEQNRHDLKATLASIEKNELSVERAKKEYWPDLTLSAGVMDIRGMESLTGMPVTGSDGGRIGYSFSVGINIPIWRDKYRAGVVEATERVIAERKQFEEVRNQILLEVRDQVIRLESLREQIELYDKVLIPQAEEMLRSTEAAYETGQLRALDLLDSERLLLSSRLMRERYRADYLKTLAKLERAVGTRFPR